MSILNNIKNKINKDKMNSKSLDALALCRKIYYKEELQDLRFTYLLKDAENSKDILTKYMKVEQLIIQLLSLNVTQNHRTALMETLELLKASK